MTLEPSRPLPGDDQSRLPLDVAHDVVPGTVRMTVAGELDDLGAPELRKTFLDAVRRHRPAAVEMNLAGVTFLDSAGIRSLVLCQADARQNDYRLTLVDTTPSIRQVLEICGLLDHFHLEPAV
jgi:anti-anti-sigma factor